MEKFEKVKKYDNDQCQVLYMVHNMPMMNKRDNCVLQIVEDTTVNGKPAC